MSFDFQATTAGFNSASSKRRFVLHPLGEKSVVLETSDPNMRVCAVAERVLAALDYGAIQEAQKTMIGLVEVAQGDNHSLSLTLQTNKPNERKSTMPDIIAAPAQKSFAPAANPAVVVDARTKSDFEISAEYGGVQYAAAVQRGQIFDCP